MYQFWGDLCLAIGALILLHKMAFQQFWLPLTVKHEWGNTMTSRHIGSRMLDSRSLGIFILLLWRISLWPEDLHTLWSALTCCNLSFFFGIVRRKRKFRKVRKFLAQLRYVSFKNLHKVWGIKNGTHLKVGHQWKIHNFCPILMKLCENDYLMS